MLEKKKLGNKTKHTDPLLEATACDDVRAVVLEVVVGAGDVLDNENPVNELVVAPEEASTLVLAEGKPAKENPAEPEEAAAAPVPAVVPEVIPNAGKLDPDVVLLVLVEVTEVAPLAGVEAVVVVTVENSGDTVVDLADEEEAALPNNEGCEGADDCVPNKKEVDVKGADVGAITALLAAVGVEAGVFFWKENPVEKLRAELAFEKEDEEPDKGVLVFVVEAVDDDDDPNRDGAELVADKELPNKDEPVLDVDERAPNEDGVGEATVPNRAEAEVVAEEARAEKGEGELVPNRAEAEVVAEEAGAEKGEGELVPNRAEAEVVAEEAGAEKGEGELVPNRAEAEVVAEEAGAEKGEGELVPNRAEAEVVVEEAGAEKGEGELVPNEPNKGEDEVVPNKDEPVPVPNRGEGAVVVVAEVVAEENGEETGADEPNRVEEGVEVVTVVVEEKENEGAEVLKPEEGEGVVEGAGEDPNENPVAVLVNPNGEGEDCVEAEVEEEKGKPAIVVPLSFCFQLLVSSFQIGGFSLYSWGSNSTYRNFCKKQSLRVLLEGDECFLTYCCGSGRLKRPPLFSS
ncbi:hypothetical protein SADUNF_Sadunf14G0036600 [Salix dunnii]|uniref:Uncharacterized protein n=1 Tax=Salix dunnii TaxID=1413687 RepID=A0A835JG23_9ROSI|nr:hypothetical protein SADUNF_Sadunf14G0036600 [Salix dunnii]